jgi:ubiquitin-conjugating enzyme E2 O
MLGFLFGNTGRSGGLETVISVRHTIYAIAWLAINQTVGPLTSDCHFAQFAPSLM